jgi:hypothetical protein
MTGFLGMRPGRERFALFAALSLLLIAMLAVHHALAVGAAPESRDGVSTALPSSPVASSQAQVFGPAQATAPIPGDWNRIEPYADTFDIALPPGWRFVEQQGVDSQIGEFVGGGIRLSFDYGAYTNTLVEPGDAGYLLTDERIDCKLGRIIEPLEDPARITGVYFSEVDREGEPPFDLVISLEVHGEDLNAAQIELVLRIVRTIRFESKCLATPTPTHSPATETAVDPAPGSPTPTDAGPPRDTAVAPATSPAPPIGSPLYLPLLSPEKG